MNQRVLPIGLFILLAALLVIGCGGGGSSGDSLSSSWLGVKSPSDGSENWQVDIRPAAVAIRPGQTIAMSVFLKNAYGHPVDGVKLLFSSQLGGTFDDTTVETEKGWASNLFTAGKQPGTESIIVIANNYSAAKPILIQSPSVSVPDLKMVTSSDVAQAGNMITVAVGVSIDGVPADDVEVRLASTLPGDFGSESGDAEKGWFTTTFKPDEDIAGVGTLTAMVNGHSVAKAITVVRGQLETPQLTISVNPDSIFQGQTASVIVISKNSSGSPATADLYFASSLSGTFNPDDGAPKDGMFFTEFTAGKEVGSATLTVFSLDASASAVLSIERPEVVVKLAASKDSVKINERIPVSVLVTDTYLRPIEDASVYLSAELGCYCDPDEGKTNDDGYMFFDFYASGTAGVSNLHALTAGATGTYRITVVGP
jgi:hypothetical protein